MTEPVPVSFSDLVARASSLMMGSRRILGITGAPGAGKSTLGERLVAALGDGQAVLVPMDGFHLANSLLDVLGRRERKGAPDTFDAAGYVSLLSRIRAQAGSQHAADVFAPEFRREIEEPVGAAIAVPASARLVITEGNYLLLDDVPWNAVRDLLDEVWFLAPPESVRMQRLTNRHRAFGRSLDEALSRTLGSDQKNAHAIRATVEKADWVIAVD